MKRRKAIKYTLAGFAQVGLLGGILTWSESCSPPPIDYTPVVFNDLEFKILEIISDIILPSSDTPGALDVKVPAGIDHFISGFMNEANQDQVKKGLNTLNLLSDKLYQSNLIDANKEMQVGVVEYLSKDANKSKDKANHFFYVIRGLIVSAYFQSEQVAKNVLHYDPNPGVYIGDYPLSDAGSNWTFNN